MHALERRLDHPNAHDPNTSRPQIQRWNTDDTVIVEPSKVTPRWHPRISPYRFIVLSTAIGFGTAKILELRAGSSSVPTTLEWVAGSVLSILFFSVSNYDTTDHNNKPPHWLQWLFLPDCMDVVWAVFSLFSLRRPHYISIEKPFHEIIYPQPPITAYRILVCAVVIIFGLGKAVLSYLNLRYPAAAWMDWTLGVPVFTILYCIGLYEYNCIDLFSAFFIVDRSDFIFSATLGVSHLALLILSAGWTYAYAYTSTFITYQPTLLTELWSSSSDNDLVFMKLIGHDILYVGVLAGVLACLLILRKIVVNVTSRHGMVRRIFSSTFSWCRRNWTISSKDNEAGLYDDTMLYELRELDQKAKKYRDKYVPKGKGSQSRVIFTPRLDLAFHVLIHVTTSLMGIVFFALLAVIVPHSQWTLERPYSLADVFIWLFRLMGIAMSWFWTLCLLAYAMALTVQLVGPFNWTSPLHSQSWWKGAKTGGSEMTTQNGQSNVEWIQREKLIGLGPFERLL